MNAEKVRAAVDLEKQAFAFYDGGKYRDALLKWLECADAWKALADDAESGRGWTCLARCEHALRHVGATADRLADEVGSHSERQTPAEKSRRH